MDRDLIAVDPGVHHCGVARAIGGELVAAWLHNTPGVPLPYLIGEKCVCELPQVYAHGKSQARKKDLINLAVAAGRVTAEYRNVKYFLPGAWKGQQTKAAQHRKMLRALTAPELAVIDAIDCAGSLRHNVLDAVCLLLVRLGRL